MKDIRAWNKNDWNEFLDRAGLYLIYAFTASLLINPFIVLWSVGRQGFSYEVPTSAGHVPPSFIINDSRDPFHLRPELIRRTEEDVIMQDRLASQISWTGVTALLGWLCTYPGVKRGIRYYKPRVEKFFGMKQ